MRMLNLGRNDTCGVTQSEGEGGGGEGEAGNRLVSVILGGGVRGGEQRSSPAFMYDKRGVRRLTEYSAAGGRDAGRWMKGRNSVSYSYMHDYTGARTDTRVTSGGTRSSHVAVNI